MFFSNQINKIKTRFRSKLFLPPEIIYGDVCVTGGLPGLQIRVTLVISVTYPKNPCGQLRTNYKLSDKMLTNRKERYGKY